MELIGFSTEVFLLSTDFCNGGKQERNCKIMQKLKVWTKLSMQSWGIQNFLWMHFEKNNVILFNGISLFKLFCHFFENRLCVLIIFASFPPVFKDPPPFSTHPTLCPFISNTEVSLCSSNILGFVALHRQAWLTTRDYQRLQHSWRNWTSSQHLTTANSSLTNRVFL